MKTVLACGLALLVLFGGVGVARADDRPNYNPVKQCRVWKNVKPDRFVRPQYAIRTCGYR